MQRVNWYPLDSHKENIDGNKPIFLRNVSYSIREEHRLRMFENRVLRRVFGPKGDEVTGGW
jgi:hypothetical protein